MRESRCRPNKPAPRAYTPGSQPLENPDSHSHSSSTLEKNDFLYRLFPLRASPRRSIEPFASYCPCPSQPLESNRGSRSHPARGGLLFPTFRIPRVAFNNRGLRDSPGGRGIRPRSVHLYGCPSPSLEDGMSCSHPLATSCLTSPSRRSWMQCTPTARTSSSNFGPSAEPRKSNYLKPRIPALNLLEHLPSQFPLPTHPLVL